MIKKIRLGDLLLENKIISYSQLEQALLQQQITGKKLGDVLIDLKFIGETELLLFLSNQLKFPFLELSYYSIKPEVIRELPEPMARRLKAIPIDRVKNSFLVAMADPTNLVAYDEIAQKLKKNIRIVIVRESQLMRVIDEVFRRTQEIASLVGQVEQEIGLSPIKGDIEDEIGDAPIKKLLHSIFEDAIQMNASDVHIEPSADGIRIRQRIDGVLHEQAMKGKAIVSALILRLKLMAKLNISERRLPQDGRFSIRVKDRKIDVRIATMPLQNGESVTLRLLDQSQGLLHLEELGMNKDYLKLFRQYLHRLQGMILVTGPTGSGKSTTLYAGLSEIDSIEKKIITVEDPVEYSFDRINQIQVQTKIGLTFSNILRSILRHDPDIVMVGEIRDEETAQIGLRAAMTGHLVLSTLHTNDAFSGPARLIDMGIEPYLAAAAIRLIISQRLVRRLCLHCCENAPVNANELTLLNAMGLTVPTNAQFSKGRGCSHCNSRGYKGRIGIYELVQMSQPMIEALRAHDLNTFEALGKKDPHYRSLTQSALDYALQGLISLDEVTKLNFELSQE
jgi:MSHA biogenesis protein MshE